MKYLLTKAELKNILEHWRSTQANAYRGSSYGHNNSALLFKPMVEEIADDILDKIKADIPIFAELNPADLAIYSEDISVDKKRVYISIGSEFIELAEVDTSNYIGDTVDANAR